MRARRLWMVLCVACVLILLVGGLLPGGGRDAIKSWLSLGDLESPAHFVLSGLIVVLAMLAVGWRWWIPVLVLTVGGFIEVLQYWVPGRSASWSDFAIDGAGVLAGLLIVWIVNLFGKRECDG